ncbi:hypothetical protein HDIA_0721 [Hartmannibacter diazotrophicus]|uniref:Uncharacterized protein n=1 Tax=Hartmannibacter diazotrophicus TaxID=1482074 RepID=A0A2C9D1R2_9HYPH|nr:hypothetical protein [Hartmannibacter diazotrophicus]SON54262.1 hypothetical protein HDIA_0721 [Hartmannibacter diazotrophicus]
MTAIPPAHTLFDRAKARLNGRTFYAGETCPAGHDGARYVANRLCAHCAKAKSRARYRADPAADNAARSARRRAKFEPCPLARFVAELIN